MDEEKCSECKNELISGEKSQCIYCELTQTTGNKSCPKCTKSVIRDKGSLYCELCKCFYHNSCNEFPLDDQYCTLLYEVPRNIKWFCDKCIWDTEKWISDYSINKDSCNSRTDVIDNDNLDTVKDILYQEKYAKSNIKKNKQNPKLKIARPRDGCSKSKISSKTLKTRTAEKKVGRIAKNNSLKLEDHSAPNKEDDKNKNDNEEVDNVSIIKKEDTNYDSTLEADDLDYHPWEADSDSDSEGRIKRIGNDKLKKKYPKKKGSKKKMGQKFQCDQCPKTFYKEHFFVAHKLWHTGDKKPYKCDLCTECFGDKRRLDQHKMKHSGEYPFVCNFCGIGKADSKSLKSHITIHSEEILKCTLCDYQTKSKHRLKYHMKDHSGENCFMCDECGLNLKSFKSLKNHQRRHTGEKPFKCEVCEKSFRFETNLSCHMFVHSKEKRFFCPVCGYGFSTKDKLDIHLKTVHSDEKPFECERCGNKYKTKHNLKNHQSGKRGSCHPMNTQKQKFESLQKFKSSSESNMSDSNDSHLVPLKQPNQQPPLLYYAGGNEKSMAPVYSNSHITATIHCPPPYLSVINYMDH